jgi:glutamate---cysteine ligase / carboxylate-amine ligase
MSSSGSLHLFEGFGIELEYAIVDEETLAVRPWCDRVLAEAAGEIVSEVERGPIAWSNELVAHQIELKTNGPVARLDGAAGDFQASLGEIDRILGAHDARLMPGGMHPWMDPSREAVLWPHEYHEVYASYDRIFGCRAHGWANVQSMHLNLPFADDREFERLHAAVRIALPILPALAASSPYVGAARAAWLDERLRHYREHASRIPSLTGPVVPEQVWDRESYEKYVLSPIWRDLASHDRDGVLGREFSNARGAIARFDRHAIEIRVIDAQECPAMDIAIAAATTALVRALVEERWCSLDQQKRVPTGALASVLWSVAEAGGDALVGDRELLGCLGVAGNGASRASELWHRLLEELDWAGDGTDGPWHGALELLIREGTLARRLVRALGPTPSRDELERVYRELCECLRDGRPFRAA